MAPARAQTRHISRAIIWMICAGVALAGLVLPPLQAADNPRSPDQVRAMQQRACEAINQVIFALAAEALKRAGHIYECEALPEGETFALIGKLHVQGSGGPTQAQLLGTIKPTPGDGIEDWTLCTLYLNGEMVDLPGC